MCWPTFQPRPHKADVAAVVRIAGEAAIWRFHLSWLPTAVTPQGRGGDLQFPE